MDKVDVVKKQRFITYWLTTYWQPFTEKS